jgi:anaerobic magnesium-protoporphyrin IX monomethyl ester cyclase
MGLLSVATVAKHEGHNVRLFDFQANSAITIESVLDFQPDLVGIAATSPSHKAALDLAAALKSRLPGVPIVKGGVHETYCGRHTLENSPQIDYSMVGEVDLAFCCLVAALQGERPLQSVPGLLYRGQGGIIESGPPVRPPKHLDEIPFVDRSLLGETAAYNFKIFDYEKTAQVQTMRGCPFMCSFCNQRNRRVLYRSVAHVLDELVELSKLGYRAVFFDDATFTVNRSRTIELMSGVTASNLRLRFGAQTRVELIDQTLVTAMADAGVEYLSFGLETIDSQGLLSVGKTRTVETHIENARRAVELCRAHGIRSCINLIVGWPGETMESMMDTFKYADMLESDYVSLSALAAYPHEDLALAQAYTLGVSPEPIWNAFDEGWGAVHRHLDAFGAARALTLAKELLGQKLDVS